VNLRLMRKGPPDGFFEDQLAAMVEARDDGLIEAVGLSSVSVDHLRRAVELTEIACVQNPYHLVDRRSESVLDECLFRGIAFVPFAPLGSGATPVLRSPAVHAVANRLECSPAQVALAWTLGRAPNVLLIPGTSSRRHMRENLAAATLDLDETSVAELSLIQRAQ
jgi:pyridoxine 4-dehydrogenase